MPTNLGDAPWTVIRKRRETVRGYAPDRFRKTGHRECFQIPPGGRQCSRRGLHENSGPAVEIGPCVDITGFHLRRAIRVIRPVRRNNVDAVEQPGQFEVGQHGVTITLCDENAAWCQFPKHDVGLVQSGEPVQHLFHHPGKVIAVEWAVEKKFCERSAFEETVNHPPRLSVNCCGRRQRWSGGASCMAICRIIMSLWMLLPAHCV